MTRILPALAALVLLKLAADAAPTAPSGPLRLVVPFSPGGGSDTFARIVQKVVRDADLSPVPVVIVNVPGAGGTIGSRQVCLLYTSPSPRDRTRSRMPSSA